MICQCYPVLFTILLTSVGTSDKKLPANFHTTSIDPYLISVFNTYQVPTFLASTYLFVFHTYLFGKEEVITVLYFFNQATGRSS